MDIDFLQNTIIPQRAKEIEEGKNAATRQPIYVVLELTENIVSGHNEYSSNTNEKGVEQECGYVDLSLEGEDQEFSESDDDMEEPEEVTRIYYDRVVAFFLTRKGAEEYLVYQKHNLCRAYIYTFYSGYANQEMDNLLKNT